MTTTEKNIVRPLYRVTFSRIIGTDENGQNILGRRREIGAVWPWKNGKPGGFLALDIVPVELTTGQGLVFLVPVTDAPKAGAQ